MNYRKHYAMNHRTHKARHRAAVLAAIAGLAVLAAGCGGGGLTVSWPSHGSGTPSSASGAGGSQVNPSSPYGNQGFVSPAKESAGTGSRSGVTGGALFGGNGPLTKVDARLGRRLAIVRVYYRIGDSFPTPQDRQLMASGSTLVVSLDSVPGTGPSYASIVAGHEDAAIGSFLRAVNQAAVTYHLGAIYFCFEHEADNPHHLELGSPSEFIRAWDHVHQLAQSAHLNWNDGGRLHWVLILEHTAYFSVPPRWEVAGGGGASVYWPGTGEVDIVAADGYNHEGCMNNASSGSAGGTGGSKPVTPAELFDPVLSFAHSHGRLPVFITEWGSQAGYASGGQPAFIAQMRSFVSANHEIAAALYFDWRSAQSLGCSSIIDNLPASLSAMAAMGHSAGLQGRIVAPA
jgi:hypothetical protein